MEQFGGLNVLGKILCADRESEIKKSNRLQKKVLMLLNDLVTNDDLIKPEDPYYTRKYIGSSEVLLKTLLVDLEKS